MDYGDVAILGGSGRNSPRNLSDMHVVTQEPVGGDGLWGCGAAPVDTRAAGLLRP
jgi:hypothetical protein